MNPTGRRAAVIVSLLLLAACSSPGPTSPTGTSRPPVVSQPSPPRASIFPPLSGPSRTFDFERQLSPLATDYTKKSRFVLYDNGAFELKYMSLGVGYRGGYRETNGIIAFEWEGGGEWSATGTLQSDSLIVQYNLMMQLSDFESAVYVLTR